MKKNFCLVLLLLLANSGICGELVSAVSIERDPKKSLSKAIMALLKEKNKDFILHTGLTFDIEVKNADKEELKRLVETCIKNIKREEIKDVRWRVFDLDRSEEERRKR